MKRRKKKSRRNKKKKRKRKEKRKKKNFTLFTTRLSIQKFCFPAQCIPGFVWFSEQNAIVSACSFNSLALIKGAEFVYCAVRTESLNIMQVNLCLNRVTICMNTSLPNRIYSLFLNHR